MLKLIYCSPQTFSWTAFPVNQLKLKNNPFSLQNLCVFVLATEAIDRDKLWGNRQRIPFYIGKIITVIFGYLFFPLIISLPYYLSIYNISFINCYFEAVSGFTSTGFTIFDNIKQIDQSLIIWRSTSQWIGGLYFLFSIILLIDIFDENLKKSLTNYLSFDSSEIFKQSFKIISGLCFYLRSSCPCLRTRIFTFF